MPQRASAVKELRKSRKRRQRNLSAKKELKNAIKSFLKVLQTDDNKKREEALRVVYKVLDKTASKKIIHKNKASRQKSRLAKKLKSSAKKK